MMDALNINLDQSHRLVTHEDVFHIHKCLGALCLLNFAYRLSIMLWSGGVSSGYNEFTVFNVFTLVIHAALHVSSFIFAISQKRNKKYNIIWPEARWHSMIFAYRSIFAILIQYVSMRTYFARCAIVIATMLATDYTTFTHTDANMKRTRTMRDNPYPGYVSENVIAVINTFYSVSQLFATIAIITRNNDQLFWVILPIQLSPFLMTLQKKGIINQAAWHMYYTLALAVNYAGYIALPDLVPTSPIVVCCFAVLRFYFGVNKYILWCIVFGIYFGVSATT